MMKLHLDRLTFETLLLGQAETSGIRADILEKDYYVTLILNELAAKQDMVPAFFKGGTALYKALGCIMRFSEDIDLTVSIEGCTNSQAKRRLERAAQDYSCLPRKRDDEEEENIKGAITSVFAYHSVVDVDHEDELQRFERVKIEATSFTVSEPHERMIIAPVIHTLASDVQKEVLEHEYGVRPFAIETIKLGRIFIDKVFAAEFYYSRRDYFDTAKHLYDMVVLLENESIRSLFSDKSLLNDLINLKRREESQRIGSDLDHKPIRQFTYQLMGMNDQALLDQFMRMQKVYVFDDEYLISIDELCNGIRKLKALFESYT